MICLPYYVSEWTSKLHSKSAWQRHREGSRLVEIEWNIQIRVHHVWELKLYEKWTSPVVQWIRMHVPVQGAGVPSLVREDSTCLGAAKSVRHNYWSSRALEPLLLSPGAGATEACAPRACGPQWKEPPQWEAHALQQGVASTHRN